MLQTRPIVSQSSKYGPAAMPRGGRPAAHDTAPSDAGVKLLSLNEWYLQRSTAEKADNVNHDAGGGGNGGAAGAHNAAHARSQPRPTSTHAPPAVPPPAAAAASAAGGDHMVGASGGRAGSGTGPGSRADAGDGDRPGFVQRLTSLVNRNGTAADPTPSLTTSQSARMVVFTPSAGSDLTFAPLAAGYGVRALLSNSGATASTAALSSAGGPASTQPPPSAKGAAAAPPHAPSSAAADAKPAGPSSRYLAPPLPAESAAAGAPPASTGPNNNAPKPQPIPSALRDAFMEAKRRAAKLVKAGKPVTSAAVMPGTGLGAYLAIPPGASRESAAEMKRRVTEEKRVASVSARLYPGPGGKEAETTADPPPKAAVKRVKGVSDRLYPARPDSNAAAATAAATAEPESKPDAPAVRRVIGASSRLYPAGGKSSDAASGSDDTATPTTSASATATATTTAHGGGVSDAPRPVKRVASVSSRLYPGPRCTEAANPPSPEAVAAASAAANRAASASASASASAAASASSSGGGPSAAKAGGSGGGGASSGPSTTPAGASGDEGRFKGVGKKAIGASGRLYPNRNGGPTGGFVDEVKKRKKVVSHAACMRALRKRLPGIDLNSGGSTAGQHWMYRCVPAMGLAASSPLGDVKPVAPPDAPTDAESAAPSGGSPTAGMAAGGSGSGSSSGSGGGRGTPPPPPVPGAHVAAKMAAFSPTILTTGPVGGEGDHGTHGSAPLSRTPPSRGLPPHLQTSSTTPAMARGMQYLQWLREFTAAPTANPSPMRVSGRPSSGRLADPLPPLDGGSEADDDDDDGDDDAADDDDADDGEAEEAAAEADDANGVGVEGKDVAEEKAGGVDGSWVDDAEEGGGAEAEAEAPSVGGDAATTRNDVDDSMSTASFGSDLIAAAVADAREAIEAAAADDDLGFVDELL